MLSAAGPRARTTFNHKGGGITHQKSVGILFGSVGEPAGEKRHTQSPYLSIIGTRFPPFAMDYELKSLKCDEKGRRCRCPPPRKWVLAGFLLSRVDDLELHGRRAGRLQLCSESRDETGPAWSWQTRNDETTCLVHSRANSERREGIATVP